MQSHTAKLFISQIHVVNWCKGCQYDIMLQTTKIYNLGDIVSKLCFFLAIKQLRKVGTWILSKFIINKIHKSPTKCVDKKGSKAANVHTIGSGKFDFTTAEGGCHSSYYLRCLQTWFYNHCLSVLARLWICWAQCELTTWDLN